MKNFIFGTAVLISTIVGVGMFGLPYSGAQSGFLIAAVFLFILAGLMTFLHLLYGEIVLRTKEKHRLVGYAGHYLGKWGRRVVSFSVIIGFYGSLLVYIVVGGDFLYTMFHSLINLPVIIFNLIFFIIGAIAVYSGIKLIVEIDLIMSVFLILIVLLFLYFGFSQIDVNNFKGINFKAFFFPYGTILYSLAGMAAMPEIREIFSSDRKSYKKAIVVGTLIPAVLYLIFMGVVIGLTGSNTSAEAIQGLSGLLGKKIIFLGALFGFLATITSFFIFGLSLKKTFSYDFKINKNLAWVLVCSVPLILFILGVREFILIIVILGALMGAIEGTAIVLISKKVQETSNFWRYVMIIIFILGFISTLICLTKP